MSHLDTTPCPCGSGAPYPRCCGPHLDGGTPAPTAEALMRSRYTAYSLCREDYLRATWHPATCPQDLALNAEVKWLGLEVLRREAGGVEDTEGMVEFVARCKLGGRAQRLHEISQFRRHQGRWVYLDGVAPAPRLPGASALRRLFS